MPYNPTTGMISINTTANPDQGVSIYDIQQALGRGVTDLGLLCSDQEWYNNNGTPTLRRANKINPWAKYKPARASDKGMIIRSLNIASLGFGTSSGTSGIPYATTVNALINLYADGETNSLYNARANGWRYLPPRGRANNEWFRMFDFIKVVSSGGSMVPVEGVGYHATARNPFGRFTCSEGVSHYSGAFNASNSSIIPSTGVEEYDIVIEDINAVMANAYRMLYYGVLLVPESSSGTCYVIFNNNKTISDDNQDENYIRGNESLKLDTFLLSDTMPIGLYTVYPFLTHMKLSTLTRSFTITNRGSAISSDNPRLYPIPGTTPGVVNVYATPVVINVYAVGNAVTVPGGGYSGSAYITIQNNSDTAVTIPRLELQWRTSNKAFNEPRATGEVFYDGQYRIDDTDPQGRADSSYQSVLRPANAYTISPNGASIRIPAGEGMTISVDIPSQLASTLVIGDPAYPNRYGSTTFRLPAGPGSNELLEP